MNTGVAYSAKLAFFDISKGATSNALILPGDLNTGVFLPMYDASARIFSNSWGKYILQLNSWTSPRLD